MSESTVTIEQVQELINTTVSGLGARQEKEFKKMLSPIAEQLTGFSTVMDEIRQSRTATQEAAPTSTPAPDPKIGVLEKQLKDLQTAREGDMAKAAKLERENALSKVLAGYQWSNDVSRDTAFKVFAGDIEVTSDSQFVIGDEPLETAVKARMEKLTGLLAPKQVGGTGQTTVVPGQNGPLEIRPGMKPEEYQSIFSNITKQIYPQQS